MGGHEGKCRNSNFPTLPLTVSLQTIPVNHDILIDRKMDIGAYYYYHHYYYYYYIRLTAFFQGQSG